MNTLVSTKEQTKTKTNEKKIWLTPRIEKISLKSGSIPLINENFSYTPES